MRSLTLLLLRRLALSWGLMLVPTVHAARAVAFGDGATRVTESQVSVVLTVERQSDDQAPFTVDYATMNGTAFVDEDYLATWGTLEFGEGECCKTIEVEILNDTLPEDEEMFRVLLRNVSAGHSLGTPSVAAIFIEDNDLGVGFVPDVYSVPEDAGVVQLMVERQTDDQAAFQVDYLTLSQEAQEGSDYVSTSGTLQFAEGEQAQIIEVEILNDGLPEEQESLQVRLRNPQGMTLAGDGYATVEIQDNDPGIHFDRDYVQVNEGEQLLELTVWRGSDDLAPFTVDYASVGRFPPEGGDYEPLSGTLSFGEGVLSETIEVRLSGDDSVWDGDQEFEIRLSQPSPGHSLSAASTVVLLVDDDVPFAWQVQPTGDPLPTDIGWRGVTWGARQFVAVGDQGSAVSQDGVHWTVGQDSDLYGLTDVVWGDGQYVAVGDSGVWRSAEGRQWEQVTSGPQEGLRWVCYGGGRYVIVSNDGQVWTTTDFNQWSGQSFTTGLLGLAYGPAGFVLTEYPGVVWCWGSGEDGWQLVGAITAGELSAVGGGAEGYVTLANHYEGEQVITEVLHSPDGINWTANRLEGVNGFWADAVIGRPGGLIAVGGYGCLRATFDGTQWTGEVASYPPAQDVARGADGYIAVGWQGLYRSQDGNLWTKLGNVRLQSITKVGEDFLALAIVGSGGFHGTNPLLEFRSTRDFINWTSETAAFLAFQQGGPGGSDLVIYPELDEASKFVVGYGPSLLRTRQETGEWIDYVTPEGTRVNALAVGQEYCVAVGSSQATETTSAIALSSVDGKQWELTDLGFTGSLDWVTHAGGWFFAQGDDESEQKRVTLRSADGVHWEPVSLAGVYHLEWVAYVKGHYFAGESLSHRLLTSEDGVEWSGGEAWIPDASYVRYGAGLFAAVDENAVFFSTDALNWRRHRPALQEGESLTGLWCLEKRFYMGSGDRWFWGAAFTLLRSPPLSYLGNPHAAPNGDLQVLAEAEPGHAYTLEVSENLVNWESLGPISISSPQESVTLPRSDSNTGRRFYRWGTSGQQ